MNVLQQQIHDLQSGTSFRQDTFRAAQVQMLTCNDHLEALFMPSWHLLASSCQQLAGPGCTHWPEVCNPMEQLQLRLAVRACQGLKTPGLDFTLDLCTPCHSKPNSTQRICRYHKYHQADVVSASIYQVEDGRQYLPETGEVIWPAAMCPAKRNCHLESVNGLMRGGLCAFSTIENAIVQMLS